MALSFRGGGNLLAQMPQRVRIWRPVEGRTHDGSYTLPTYRDVYGVDIPCRIKPDTFSMEMGVQGAPGLQPLTCDLPARDSDGRLVRINVFPPDIFEVKWTRRRGPRRRLVETTLTSNAAATTTALNVSDSWGFEAEEIVVLETAAADDWHVGLVDNILGDVVTLRDIHEVPTGKSFVTGDTVKVSWTAEVVGTRNPLATDHLHVVSIRRGESGEWHLR
jgi:hypothetical protein